MPRRADRLTFSDKLLLKGIEAVSDQIADVQDELTKLRQTRDDLIREGVASDISKTEIAVAAELSVDQIRNIETHRYSRESRRDKQRNPGPPRD